MVDFEVHIPVYNTPAPYLAECVYSILNQKDLKRHFNVLLINDGSFNPDTLSMLEYFNGRNNIKVIHVPHGGQSAAMNAGIQMATTEYICRQDADDYSHEQRLAMQLSYINKHRPDILGTNLFGFYNSDIYRKAVFTTAHPEVPVRTDGWLVNHGTAFYRTDVVKSIGGYDVNWKRAQDKDLWKRLNEKGFVFRNIKEVLYAYRRY